MACSGWTSPTRPRRRQGRGAARRLIRSADAEDARPRRGFRSPARPHEVPAASRPPPQYGFQGRAREFYELERSFGATRHCAACHGRHGQDHAGHRGGRLVDAQPGSFRDGAASSASSSSPAPTASCRCSAPTCAGPNSSQFPAAEQRAPRHRAVPADTTSCWSGTTSRASCRSSIPTAASRTSPYTDDERRRLAELFRDLTGSAKARTAAGHLPSRRHRPARRLAI